jgi:hypothetical protein
MRAARYPLLVLGAWLLAIGLAWARPGGGETFSGPSDSGSGDSTGHGNGDNGVELVIFLLRLILVYPKVGVPLALIALVVFVVLSKKRDLESWDTPHQAHVAVVPVRVRSQGQARTLVPRLSELRALDPDFSRVLLEDFAYRLFASVQRARSDSRALEALAPYLDAGVRAGLLRNDGTSVVHVVVGALRIEDVTLPAAGASPAFTGLSLLYEANLRLRRAGSSDEHSVYTRERWSLRRAAEARTKPPGSYERLGCPNCGAPFASSDDRRCDYCQQVVSDGRFNWQLVQRQCLSEEPVLGGLGGHVEERGTDNPTVFAPDQDERWQALSARDPAVNEAALVQRANEIHAALNQAWSAQALGRVRGLVSDGLFDYLSYWIEAYHAAGLRNVLEATHVERCQRVKVVEDRFFDAVTLRVFASGLDYTVRADTGEHVSGDAHTARRYSEYWTLIRAANVRGAVRSAGSCPSCAAPLQVSMAGQCSHCGAHITQGEFDWVLSKIEQDDVYEG